MGQWFASWALHPLRGPSAAALGLLLAIAETAARIALNPMLDGQFIFLLYFPALLVSSAWGGLTAGIVTGGIGGLAAVFLSSPAGHVSLQSALSDGHLSWGGRNMMARLSCRRRGEASEAV